MADDIRNYCIPVSRFFTTQLVYGPQVQRQTPALVIWAPAEPIWPGLRSILNTFGDGYLLSMHNDSYKFLKMCWHIFYCFLSWQCQYLEFAGPLSVPTASGDRDLGATTRRHVQWDPHPCCTTCHYHWSSHLV